MNHSIDFRIAQMDFRCDLCSPVLFINTFLCILTFKPIVYVGYKDIYAFVGMT